MYDLPEIIVESATQSPEEVAAELEKLGYDGVNTSGQSDQPEPAPKPAAAVEEEETPEEPPAPKPVKGAPTKEPTSETPDAGGDAAGDEGSQAAGDDTPAAPQHKPKPGSARYREQARIARENEERTKQENEALKRELADLRAGTPKPATPPPTSQPAKPAAEALPPVPEAKPKPKYEDFADEEDQFSAFTEAMTDWKLEERDRLRIEADNRRKQEENQAKQTQEVEESRTRAAKDLEETQQRWNSSTETAKLRFDDFDEVMNRPRTQPVHPALVAAVIERDDVEPAELAYWLTAHPEKEQALAKLVASLPTNPTALQVNQMKRRLHAALDPIVNELIEADEAEPEPIDAAPSQDQPGTAASREARAAAAPPVSAPAAKKSPQNPPPQAQAAPPPPPPKKKPAVPAPVGGRGASTPLSAMERAQKGQPVNADDYRAEWERKNRSLPI